MISVLFAAIINSNKSTFHVSINIHPQHHRNQVAAVDFAGRHGTFYRGALADETNEAEIRY